MKIKLSKNQWEAMGKQAGWAGWHDQSPVERYIVRCVEGMMDLRGGISRQNAAGQLADYAKQYYEYISGRVNVPSR